MIADYKFSGKEPSRETILSSCNEKPKLLDRKKYLPELTRNYSKSLINLMIQLASLNMKNK